MAPDSTELADAIELAAFIELPGHLQANAEQSAQALDKRLSELARPQWDEAVAYLPLRYGDLVALREGVFKRLERAQEDVAKHVRPLRRAYAILDVLETEVKRYGADRTIGESVSAEAPPDPDSPTGSDWTWNRAQTGGGYSFKLNPEVAHAFGLLDREPEPQGGAFGIDDRPPAPLGGVFPFDTTWGDALRSHLDEYRDPFEAVGSARRYAATLRFRGQILDAVLEAYEVLGAITIWDDRRLTGRYERLAANEEVVSICQALLRAKEAEPFGLIDSRNRLYEAAADHLPGLSKDNIRNRLEAAAVQIHHRGEGQGRLARPEERRQLESVLADASRVVERAKSNRSQ